MAQSSSRLVSGWLLRRNEKLSQQVHVYFFGLCCCCCCFINVFRTSFTISLPSQKVRGALVSARVLVQVLLVILLGVVPDTDLGNLGDNVLALVVLLLNLSSDTLGDLLLLGRVVEDGRAVLSANIGSLAVGGGGVMHAVEELDKVGVVDLVVGGVVDLDGLGVVCGSGADLVMVKKSKLSL